MKLTNLLIPFLAISLLIGTQVNAACLFNGETRDCRGVTGRGRTPLSKGSDLDILWEDGEVTTIKYLHEGATYPQKVLINGSINGVETYRRDICTGVFEVGFVSATGNIFAIWLGD